MTMEKRIYVKPREGLLIRDEYTGEHFPSEGREVKYTTLVRKHLQVGDLIECAPPGEAPSTKRERMIPTKSEG